MFLLHFGEYLSKDCMGSLMITTAFFNKSVGLSSLDTELVSIPRWKVVDLPLNHIISDVQWELVQKLFSQVR